MLDYKKKELCHNRSDFLWYPSQYLEYARNLLTLSRCEWDYELEKSYWFDTTATNASPQESKKLTPIEEWETNSPKSVKPGINEEHKKLSPATADNTGKMMNNQVNLTNQVKLSSNNNEYKVSTEVQVHDLNVSLDNVDVKKDVIVTNDSMCDKKLGWENLEEKLNHMLG